MYAIYERHMLHPFSISISSHESDIACLRVLMGDLSSLSLSVSAPSLSLSSSSSLSHFGVKVDFLLAAHRRHARPSPAAVGLDSSSSSSPLHVLELAAGPARHCLAALQVGVEVWWWWW